MSIATTRTGVELDEFGSAQDGDFGHKRSGSWSMGMKNSSGVACRRGCEIWVSRRDWTCDESACRAVGFCCRRLDMTGSFGIDVSPYPGRGAVIGRANDGELFELYFISGRSSASRDRTVSLTAEASLRVVPTTPGPVDEIRHYEAMVRSPSWSVVGNGDHVRKMAEHLEAGEDFNDVLHDLQYEPDEPIFTPRIVAASSRIQGSIKSICVGSATRTPDGTASHQTFLTDYMAPGTAIEIHTYSSDGELINSDATPRVIRLTGDIRQIADECWAALDTRFRVFLVARLINSVRDFVLLQGEPT
jgi:hypothetical protein